MDPPAARATADIPTPLVMGAQEPAAEAASADAPPGTPTTLASLEDCAVLAQAKRDIALKSDIERHMRPISFEPGRIEFTPTPDAAADLAGRLGKALTVWTGQRWIVTVGQGGMAPTLAEARERAMRVYVAQAKADATVAAVLDAFEGAKIVDVRIRKTDRAGGEYERLDKSVDVERRVGADTGG